MLRHAWSNDINVFGRSVVRDWKILSRFSKSERVRTKSINSRIALCGNEVMIDRRQTSPVSFTLSTSWLNSLNPRDRHQIMFAYAPISLFLGVSDLPTAVQNRKNELREYPRNRDSVEILRVLKRLRQRNTHRNLRLVAEKVLRSLKRSSLFLALVEAQTDGKRHVRHVLSNVVKRSDRSA